MVAGSEEVSQAAPPKIGHEYGNRQLLAATTSGSHGATWFPHGGGGGGGEEGGVGGRRSGGRGRGLGLTSCDFCPLDTGRGGIRVGSGSRLI